MRKTNWVILMVIVAAALFLWGCTKEKAEEAAGEAGLDITFDEGDIGVETPAGWTFMFGITLDADQAELLDKNFAIDLAFLESVIDFDKIEQMIAIAKVEDLEGYGKRLRYANKLIVRDKALQLDTDTLDKLGDSIGSAGAGLYAAYYAADQNGYIHGKIVDCDGGAIQDALAIITGGPFFSYSSDDGTWALPTLAGLPAAVNLTGENCVCSVAAPSTNTAENPNPKDNTGEGDTPPSDTFEDNTYVVEAADCVCCPPETIPDDDADDTVPDDDVADDTTDDTTDDDTTVDDTTDDDTTVDDTADDDADDTVPDDDADDDAEPNCIDFEDGSLAGWSYSSECSFFGISAEAYEELFEAGEQHQYLYVSSGGNQVASCTMTATMTVPAGAAELEVSYNFVSQEYAEWVNSAYNDIFTLILQGAPDYLVNRTVNNVATDNDWFEIASDSPAATIAGIAGSSDAQYNPTLTSPFSNGPYKFDGMLDWSSDPTINPRGNPYDANRGKTSTVALPEDMSTITLILTVSDVGDRIYDSAGLVDWICFKE